MVIITKKVYELSEVFIVTVVNGDGSERIRQESRDHNMAMLYASRFVPAFGCLLDTTTKTFVISECDK